jgi:hypothetical protein
VVVLREGPRVMFGDDARIADKWRAAAGVLASKHSQGAAYVDVRMPDRPVAGGLGSVPAPPAVAPSTPAGGSPPAAEADPSTPPAPAPAEPPVTVP